MRNGNVPRRLPVISARSWHGTRLDVRHATETSASSSIRRWTILGCGEPKTRLFGGTTRRGAAPATPPPCDTLTPRPSAIDAATGGGVAASFLLRDACPHASPARLPRAGPVAQVSGGNERRSARRVWRVARQTDTTGTLPHRASGCVRGASSRDPARGRLRIASETATPPRKRSTGYWPPVPTPETPHGAKNRPIDARTM